MYQSGIIYISIRPKRYLKGKRKIKEFIIDETPIKIGSEIRNQE
jgi:hypothetical protein